MRIVIGMTESDCHTVSLYMFKLYLEEQGFEVRNLGACVPLEALFSEAMTFKADAIVIGAQNGHAVDDLKTLNLFKKRYCDCPPVFVGGRLAVGVGNTERAEVALKILGVDHILRNFEDFALIASASVGWPQPETMPVS